MRLPAAWSDTFEILHCAAGTLVLARRYRETLLRAGLDRPEVWESPGPPQPRGSGRGPTVRIELPDAAPLLLKQMRRGGWLAPLWRDRFPGTRRLLANLWMPHEAAQRGVPTPRTAALRLVEGPPWFHRAWLAVEVVDGAVDLAARLAGSPPLDRSRIALVAQTIRAMHDRGLDHPDLNLGNLLLRETETAVECFVIDLDGARLRSAALSPARRERALRRLERSTFKTLGPSSLGSQIARQWYESYAADDRELSRRLAVARRRNRFRLSLHRLGWRR